MNWFRIWSKEAIRSYGHWLWLLGVILVRYVSCPISAIFQIGSGIFFIPVFSIWRLARLEGVQITTNCPCLNFSLNWFWIWFKPTISSYRHLLRIFGMIWYYVVLMSVFPISAILLLLEYTLFQSFAYAQLPSYRVSK